MTTVVGILIYPKSDYTYVVYMLKNLTLSANLFEMQFTHLYVTLGLSGSESNPCSFHTLFSKVRVWCI